MNISQKQSRVKKKYSIRTEPNEILESTLLRSSLADQAKQQLREISQFYEMSSDIIQELDWSTTIEKGSANHLVRKQGCFEIHLSKIQSSSMNKDSKVNRAYSQLRKSKKQQRQVGQWRRMQPRDLRRKSRATYVSNEYILKENNRLRQSRIHSIQQLKLSFNESHFIVNEEVFKQAAEKLQKHVLMSRTSPNQHESSNQRCQNQLVIRKKVGKTKDNEKDSVQRAIKIIELSPKILPINSNHSANPIRKRKISFPIKVGLEDVRKREKTTI